MEAENVNVLWKGVPSYDGGTKAGNETFNLGPVSIHAPAELKELIAGLEWAERIGATVAIVMVHTVDKESDE